MKLPGRSAIVAGGAGGLGGATVRRLVEQGAGVVILDPDAERSAALADGLGRGRVGAVVGDSNDDDAVHQAIALAQALGTFSIAVSATGVVIPSQPLVSRDGSILSKEALRRQPRDPRVRPVQLGPVVCGRVRRQRSRCRRPTRGDRPDRLDQRLRRSGDHGPVCRSEGGDRVDDPPHGEGSAPRSGIRVCAVAPGAFATPRLSSPEVQEMLVRDVTFPARVGQPDEYASLVEQIITNPYLNGEVIRIDGGARLGPRMGAR